MDLKIAPLFTNGANHLSGPMPLDPATGGIAAIRGREGFTN
jgi:hypothetical protein